jgi:hypothetical protein
MRKALFIPEHETKIPARQLLLDMAAISLNTGFMSVTFSEGQAQFKLSPEQLEKAQALVADILLTQESFKLGEFKDVPDEVVSPDDASESTATPQP